MIEKEVDIGYKSAIYADSVPLTCDYCQAFQALAKYCQHTHFKLLQAKIILLSSLGKLVAS